MKRKKCKHVPGCSCEPPVSIGRNTVGGRLTASLPIRVESARDGTLSLLVVGPGGKTVRYIIREHDQATIELPIDVTPGIVA